MVASVVLTISVGNARQSASSAERRWSETQSVWVASADIEAGRPITSDHIAAVELPMAALPDDATTDNPIGRRPNVSMARGEILREGRLAERGVGPVAALLGPTDRGITIQIDEGSVLDVGDRVELLALVGGRTLAVGAEVISVDGRWATFSVAAGQVSGVVNEMAVGGVIPVLVP